VYKTHAYGEEGRESCANTSFTSAGLCDSSVDPSRTEGGMCRQVTDRRDEA